ncbi:hypothetical protein PVAP13_8KG096036 [Panicum virgatum]|uniref:Uncharacterized protein n=1 Tax=Panicum virgatum TaxID=38727 RepID=A0A8T0PIH3_PANVG|nr:hypothetical protein PVAP13_8KG096036 [Panicum virgatum]
MTPRRCRRGPAAAGSTAAQICGRSGEEAAGEAQIPHGPRRGLRRRPDLRALRRGGGEGGLDPPCRTRSRRCSQIHHAARAPPCPDPPCSVGYLLHALPPVPRRDPGRHRAPRSSGFRTEAPAGRRVPRFAGCTVTRPAAALRPGLPPRAEAPGEEEEGKRRGGKERLLQRGREEEGEREVVAVRG